MTTNDRYFINLAIQQEGTTGVGRRAPTPASRVVVLPDIHFPFQDDDRLNEALLDCREADHIIILGDLLDGYDISDFSKDGNRRFTLNDELVLGREFLARLRRQNTSARIDLIEGNHEQRWKRYLGKAPAAASVDSVRNLIPLELKVDQEGIHYHKRSGFVAYGRRFKHGDYVRAKAGRTADAEMSKHLVNGFSGHTHRLGPSVFSDKEGRRWEWWECGHLSDVSKVEYIDNPDWQAGYITFDVANDGSIRVRPIYL